MALNRSSNPYEWWDSTWNPFSGCEVISDGCKYCYAKVIAERFAGGKAFPHGGVPFWFKQFGGPYPSSTGSLLEGRAHNEFPTFPDDKEPPRKLIPSEALCHKL